jgi:hypothetical protein
VTPDIVVTIAMNVFAAVAVLCVGWRTRRGPAGGGVLAPRRVTLDAGRVNLEPARKRTWQGQTF